MPQSLFNIKEISVSLAKNKKKVSKAKATATRAGNKKIITIKARRLERCQDVIGKIKMGEDIHYASCGEWSSHELLAHILNQTGPAHVMFSTWSVSEMAIRLILKWMQDKKILSLDALLDWRVKVRRPEVLELLRFNLSKTNLYLTNCHAKVAVIKNNSWAVSIVGSANFTNNPRIEAGVISCSRTAANFHTDWILREIKRAKPFE